MARRSAAVAAAAALAVALGLFCLGNGAAMLAAPHLWYSSVPGVPLTGGYNAHFVRDIGIVYALAGAALILGALRPAARAVLWSAAAAWLAAHAALHLLEAVAGTHGAEAIARDFAGVILPASVALALAIGSWRGGSSAS